MARYITFCFALLFCALQAEGFPIFDEVCFKNFEVGERWMFANSVLSQDTFVEFLVNGVSVCNGVFTDADTIVARFADGEAGPSDSGIRVLGATFANDTHPCCLNVQIRQNGAAPFSGEITPLCSEDKIVITGGFASGTDAFFLTDSCTLVRDNSTNSTCEPANDILDPIKPECQVVDNKDDNGNTGVVFDNTTVFMIVGGSVLAVGLLTWCGKRKARFSNQLDTLELPEKDLEDDLENDLEKDNASEAEEGSPPPMMFGTLVDSNSSTDGSDDSPSLSRQFANSIKSTGTFMKSLTAKGASSVKTTLSMLEGGWATATERPNSGLASSRSSEDGNEVDFSGDFTGGVETSMELNGEQLREMNELTSFSSIQTIDIPPPPPLSERPDSVMPGSVMSAPTFEEKPISLSSNAAPPPPAKPRKNATANIYAPPVDDYVPPMNNPSKERTTELAQKIQGKLLGEPEDLIQNLAPVDPPSKEKTSELAQQIEGKLFAPQETMQSVDSMKPPTSSHTSVKRHKPMKKSKSSNKLERAGSSKNLSPDEAARKLKKKSSHNRLSSSEAARKLKKKPSSNSMKLSPTEAARALSKKTSTNSLDLSKSRKSNKSMKLEPPPGLSVSPQELEAKSTRIVPNPLLNSDILKPPTRPVSSTEAAAREQTKKLFAEAQGVSLAPVKHSTKPAVKREPSSNNLKKLKPAPKQAVDALLKPHGKHSSNSKRSKSRNKKGEEMQPKVEHKNRNKRSDAKKSKLAMANADDILRPKAKHESTTPTKRSKSANKSAEPRAKLESTTPTKRSKSANKSAEPKGKHLSTTTPKANPSKVTDDILKPKARRGSTTAAKISHKGKKGPSTPSKRSKSANKTANKTAEDILKPKGKPASASKRSKSANKNKDKDKGKGASKSSKNLGVKKEKGPRHASSNRNGRPTSTKLSNNSSNRPTSARVKNNKLSTKITQSPTTQLQVKSAVMNSTVAHIDNDAPQRKSQMNTVMSSMEYDV